MHKHVLNIVPDMMNVIILHDVINRYKVLGVSMSHNTKIYGRDFVPYNLIIYIVRSLADGNTCVIDSYSCIISLFSELGVT